MKRIHILTIFTIAVSFLASCTKEDPTTLDTSTAYSATKDYNYTSSFNYTLVPIRPNPAALFVWDNGYVNATQLDLNVYHVIKDPTSLERFGRPINKVVSLLNPTMLGNVPMPAITCSMASFAIELNPSGATHSLLLNGRFNSVVDMPPTPPPYVQVIIDDPVIMTSGYIKDLVISNGVYGVSLQLNMAMLSNGINRELMAQAVINNNTILISKTSNPQLYTIIFANLQNILSAQVSTQSVNQAAGYSM